MNENLKTLTEEILSCELAYKLDKLKNGFKTVKIIGQVKGYRRGNSYKE